MLPSADCSNLRTCRFKEVREESLTHPNDVLVSRRVSALRPVTFAHAEDIWSLATSLSNSEPIPWVLVKNGKRSKRNLEKLRSSSKCQTMVERSVALAESLSQNISLSQFPPSSSIPEVSQDNKQSFLSPTEPQTSPNKVLPKLPCSSDVAFCLMMKDIYSIKQEISDLRSQLSAFPDSSSVINKLKLLKKCSGKIVANQQF